MHTVRHYVNTSLWLMQILFITERMKPTWVTFFKNTWVRFSQFFSSCLSTSSNNRSKTRSIWHWQQFVVWQICGWSSCLSTSSSTAVTFSWVLVHMVYCCPAFGQCNFLNLKFHKEVYMWSIFTYRLLQISHRVCQWKNAKQVNLVKKWTRVWCLVFLTHHVYSKD